MNGIELCGRYVLPSCKTSGVGTRSFPAVFDLYLKKQIDQWDLKNELERFITVSSYLHLIGTHADKDPFDYEVVEAFWVGNHLLDQVPHKEFKRFIIEDLVRAGLKKDRARSLCDQLPSTAVPHHSFHVFYLLPSFENVVRNVHVFCDQRRIGWGKVVFTHESMVKLDYRSLLYKNKLFSLSKSGKKISRGLVEEVERADFVSQYQGVAIHKLTERQVANLERYTQRTIALVNVLNTAL